MLSLILALLFSAAISLGLKIFSRDGNNRYGIIIGNYVTCVVMAFLVLPEKGLLFHAQGITYLIGIFTGFLFVGGMVATQISIQKNGATLTAAFSKLGLLISLALAVFVYGERPGVLQIGGVGLAVVAMLLINSKPEKQSASPGQVQAPVLLFLALLFSGSAEAMSKVFERVGNREEDAVFLFLIFFTAAVLSGLLAFREYCKTGKRLVLKEVLSGIAVGLPNYFSSYMLLRALVSLPAFLVYPVFCTGSILVVMTVCILFLGERLSRKQALGIALILAALVLLNL